MKIYVAENSVILSGKAWEIKRKLAEYSRTHTLMAEWIESIHTKGEKAPKKHQSLS
ncbi:Z-ring formation inhibitor MciZ [Peribacillus kribbensis]|uniref:Z-ring formation inhibitor MciZ n=1 Tax=Peribacillus kribbensis TaxID=356658 RepID=UPI0003FD983A|nr:Z-ring formation inhibitor MciZ [Peribacillus kribbensis]